MYERINVSFPILMRRLPTAETSLCQLVGFLLLNSPNTRVDNDLSGNPHLTGDVWANAERKRKEITEISAEFQLNCKNQLKARNEVEKSTKIHWRFVLDMWHSQQRLNPTPYRVRISPSTNRLV